VNALIFGASGGLATALADALMARQWSVDLVTRKERREALERRYATAVESRSARIFSVAQKYSDFDATQSYNAYFFTQSLFWREPLVSMNESDIASQLEVGLAEPIRLTRKLLLQPAPSAGVRSDYCFIGSTSSYAGFRDTSVYCAVKHGMLGFVRAMNDEYAQSDTRFWLFSMGTMNTEMGAKLTAQDPSSFLQPDDVAERLVEAISSPSNLFEPELLIRRRTIRFLEK
jgi:NAD(P)-dependent dehydrogenase (short-subunit alcohol dehydrogenase family)